MSLISGKYWIGDPTIKPEAWGPAEDVQANMLDKMSAIGLPVKNLKIAMPLWERVGNPYDYARGIFTDASNTTMTNKGFLCDADNEHLDPLITGESVFRDPTPASISTVIFGYQNVVAPSSYHYYFTTKPYEAGSFTLISIPGGTFYGILGSTDANYVGGSGVNSEYYASLLTDGNPHVFGLSCRYDEIPVFVLDNRITVGSAPIGSFSNFADSGIVFGGRADSAGRYSGGNMSFILNFNTNLSADQMLLVSENPWQFWQPPTFRTYFIQDIELTINCSDIVTTSETITINVGTAIHDSGSGEDVFSDMDADIPISDLCSGYDNVSPAVSLSVSETSEAVDIISQIINSASIADTGVAIDSLAQVIAAMVISDTGAGVSGVDISVLGEVVKAVSDAGAGLDTVESPTVSFSISDSVAMSDFIAAISAAVSVQDSVSATDLVNIIKTQLVQISDECQGNDAISMSVAVTVDDVATAADAVGQVLAAINLSDVGSGLDSVIATNFDLLPSGKVTITFSIKVPGASFDMRKPGGTISIN